MKPNATADSAKRRLGLAGATFNAFVGYGISMALLAVVSLVSIPSMVAASGPVAWGMIAAGQSIGGVAATVIGYGWGLSGPAAIAQANSTTRLTEYIESVATKLYLFIPVGAIAFLAAFLIGREFAVFAGVAALSQATIGLLANWYFVGIARPYLLLVLETVPRTLGTIVGIIFMDTGSSALVGVTWQLIGPVAAFVVSTVWIVKPWRRSALRQVSPRRVRAVLVDQRHGVTSTVLSSFYSAAPVVIVALVAPAAQPVYAVVDKVQRQVIVALGPFVTVLQGWVPRASGEALLRRVRIGLWYSLISAVVLGAAMAIAAPELVRWLGGRQIHPTLLTLALMAVLVGVAFFESILSKACLAALRKLRVVATSTAIGSVVGLPLVAVGAVLWGAPGAIAGILCGLGLRVLLEGIGLRRGMVEPMPIPAGLIIEPVLGLDE
jgi:O-antigen/teichoic acid export membrane protein